jgi:pimeloyl-ACP methyl ester carboxylesterase
VIESISVTASDGVATGARRAGAHGPAIAFVHGVGSTAAIWDSQLAAFGDRFRCFAVELRGNGVPKPEPDPSAITREGFARDVLAVADAAGIDRFTIVGCSLGGVIAFELWKTMPQRIDAMAIVGSFARYPNAQVYADGVKEALRAAGDMPAFAAQRAGKLGLPPARLRETIDQMACKDVTSYAASTQATWTGDYTAVLPTIDVPVFVTCGEHDAIAPLALSQEIHRGIAHSRLKVIENAGHVANADAPERFNALLRDFLAEVYSG